MDRWLRVAALTLALAAVIGVAPGSTETQAEGAVSLPPGATFDRTAPPGTNFDKAEFRFWLPAAASTVRAVLTLAPGSNGDGRPMIDDPGWRTFASKHGLALLGVRFTDAPHEQPFIEHYINVSQGSGQALLEALDGFSRDSAHPEIATAPLLMWGMSAGGQFNYEFVHWKPERVLAFVVNKGGIYSTALTARAARNVPGLLCIGGRDLDSRNQTITGLFALNRRAGALWALAEEPGVAHVIGRSRDLALLFFEDALSLRLPDASTRAGGLRALTESSGYLGDPKTKEIWKTGEKPGPPHPASWLPTERLARAWAAFSTERQFEP